MTDILIDLERVVIDPDYRREMIERLNRASTPAAGVKRQARTASGGAACMGHLAAAA